MLLPGLNYEYDVEVINIDPHGLADDIRVMLSTAKSCVPIIAAVVLMPTSEVLAE